MMMIIKIFLSFSLIISVSYNQFLFWQRAPLNLFCSDTLEDINVDVRNDMYGKISSLIIYYNSRIVYEKYYGFSQSSTLHPISSVTKSITSIAVGVCIDNGIIPTLDVKIEDYFPEYKQIFDKTPLKKEITLRHLLMQTGGFEWDEWTIHYSYAGNPLIEMSQMQQNWIPYILKLPMDSPPGEKFSYNSACSDLIKEIVERSSGMSFKDFVNTHIFKKMSIAPFHWDTYATNGEPAWGGLSLTTRDMAKFGILLLNQGVWAGNRIVSDDWIKQSISPMVTNDTIAYGYHWWIGRQPDSNTLVYAAGYGDQYVYVAPDKGLVVAFNGKNFTDHKWEKNHSDLIKRILMAYRN